MPIQKLPLFLMAADVCEPTSVYGETCSSSVAQPEPKSGEGDMCVADSCKKGSGGKKTETKKTAKKTPAKKEPPPEDPSNDEPPGAPEDPTPERDTDIGRVDDPPPDPEERPPLPNIPPPPGQSRYVPPPPPGKPPKPGTPERPSGGGRSFNLDLSWLYKFAGIHLAVNPEVFTPYRQAPSTSRFSALFSPCVEHVFTVKQILSLDIAGCYLLTGIQRFSEEMTEDEMTRSKFDSEKDQGVIGRGGVGLIAKFLTLQAAVAGGALFEGGRTKPFIQIEAMLNFRTTGSHYIGLGGVVVPYLEGSSVSDPMVGVKLAAH